MLDIYINDLKTLIQCYEQEKFLIYLNIRSENYFIYSIRTLVCHYGNDDLIPKGEILNIINQFFECRDRDKSSYSLLAALFSKLGFFYQNPEIMPNLINIFKILHRNNLLSLKNFNEIDALKFYSENINAIEYVLEYLDKGALLNQRTIEILFNNFNFIKLCAALKSFPADISKKDFRHFLKSDKLTLLLAIFDCIANFELKVTKKNFLILCNMQMCNFIIN